jgi:hypothetical protein
VFSDTGFSEPGRLPIARLIGVDKSAATNRGYCETKAILSLAILVLVPTIPAASAQGKKLYVFVQTDAAEGVSRAPTNRNYTSRVVCNRGNPLWSIPGNAPRTSEPDSCVSRAWPVFDFTGVGLATGAGNLRSLIWLEATTWRKIDLEMPR